MPFAPAPKTPCQSLCMVQGKEHTLSSQHRPCIQASTPHLSVRRNEHGRGSVYSKQRIDCPPQKVISIQAARNTLNPAPFSSWDLRREYENTLCKDHKRIMLRCYSLSPVLARIPDQDTAMFTVPMYSTMGKSTRRTGAIQATNL